MEGKITLFRHIDMNVLIYLESDHGANIIQGSVSLDNEASDGCMVAADLYRSVAVENRFSELS